VIDEIREDVRLNRVPLIVVSGRHDVHESFDEVLGAENVFAKPLDPAALLGRVDELLREGSP
jgi:DNA-binding response OmpR family regulator